jgi:phage-related protein
MSDQLASDIRTGRIAEQEVRAAIKHLPMCVAAAMLASVLNDVCRWQYEEAHQCGYEAAKAEPKQRSGGRRLTRRSS